MCVYLGRACSLILLNSCWRDWSICSISNILWEMQGRLNRYNISQQGVVYNWRWLDTLGSLEWISLNDFFFYIIIHTLNRYFQRGVKCAILAIAGGTAYHTSKGPSEPRTAHWLPDTTCFWWWVSNAWVLENGVKSVPDVWSQIHVPLIKSVIGTDSLMWLCHW